jgi:glycosyltransferase involved in cell wall biosynthesis
MIIFNALQTSLSGGIGRYSYELARAIYQLQQIDLKIVIRAEDIQSFSFAENSDLIIVEGIKNSKDRNQYEQFVLPKKIAKEYPKAIIHYPDTMAPIFSKNPVIITVHDLAFITRMNDFTLKSRLWKRNATRLSVKKADKIIAITEFTESEIQKYFSSYSSKVSVIYNGFNNFAKDAIDIGKVRDEIKRSASEEYILTVSTISPRKNIDGLIKAFNLIKDKLNHKLVVAGGNGWLYENIYKLVEELKLENRVIFTNKVNDDELKYLYKNASVFVYSSFYEGFGLPPLEAMSYGIPCVVSNVTSMPEVIGDSALYIDPSSVNDMSDRIYSLCNDRELQNKLSSLGYIRLNKYDWNKCAKETIKSYKNMI